MSEQRIMQLIEYLEYIEDQSREEDADDYQYEYDDSDFIDYQSVNED